MGRFKSRPSYGPVVVARTRTPVANILNRRPAVQKMTIEMVDEMCARIMERCTTMSPSAVAKVVAALKKLLVGKKEGYMLQRREQTVLAHVIEKAGLHHHNFVKMVGEIVNEKAVSSRGKNNMLAAHKARVRIEHWIYRQRVRVRIKMRARRRDTLVPYIHYYKNRSGNDTTMVRSTGYRFRDSNERHLTYTRYHHTDDARHAPAIAEQGQYTRGTQTGIWTTYNSDGDAIERVRYNSHGNRYYTGCGDNENEDDGNRYYIGCRDNDDDGNDM